MTEKAKAGTQDKPDTAGKKTSAPQTPKEVNGPKGPEPTRFGDWEKGGRCFDF